MCIRSRSIWHVWLTRIDALLPFPVTLTPLMPVITQCSRTSLSINVVILEPHVPLHRIYTFLTVLCILFKLRKGLSASNSQLFQPLLNLLLSQLLRFSPLTVDEGLVGSCTGLFNLIGTLGEFCLCIPCGGGSGGAASLP